MKHGLKKRSSKSGLPPGTPVHIGQQRTDTVTMTVCTYSDKDFHEQDTSHVDECLALAKKPGIRWVAVHGIHQIEILQRLASSFGLHPLVIEDIANTEQRPKVEDYGEYLFAVLKGLHLKEETSEITVEQVSLVLGQDFVLSFQEGSGNILQAVRERLRNGKGRVRTLGSDYLAYTLTDAVVDHYFAVLEHSGEHIERLEEELVTNPGAEALQALHRLKRDMIVLRKAVWPLREVIGHFERGDSPLIKKSTLIYFRDVYDHTIQVIETTETFRDMLAGMLDIYLTTLSNRLNETMKVLTVIATIFIPLTLIASIYGMNFKHMPELEWWWGYPLVLAVMGILGGLMVWYFRKKRWI